MCALGQVLRLSIACLYGVVGGGWALSAPLAQKGNSYHFLSPAVVPAQDSGRMLKCGWYPWDPYIRVDIKPDRDVDATIS